MRRQGAHASDTRNPREHPHARRGLHRTHARRTGHRARLRPRRASRSTRRPSTRPNRSRRSWLSAISALNADAKTSTRKVKSRSDKAAAEKREHGNKSQTKGGGVKKTAKGPTTIDDVLEDIDNKLDLIKGVSRPEACRKMTDAISKDSSLTEGDKKSLSELVGRLADEH